MSTDRSPGEWNLAVRQQAAVAHLGQVGLQSSDLEEVLRSHGVSDFEGYAMVPGTPLGEDIFLD